MGYKPAHAPVYGYMKGYKHTIPLHLVHYARTFSIFKLLNRLALGNVLNVGGADGYHSYLIQKIFTSDVTTLDINPDALAIAKKSYGLTVKLGSALEIPFPDNSFDTVLCIETIEHIEDSEKVVAELKRIARNNIIISTESFFDSEEQKEAFLLYLHETHPFFFRTVDPVPTSDVAYFTLDDFKRLFGTPKLDFYPQFSHKQMEILGSIDDIRSHVKSMTEGLPVNKRTKVIVHYSKEETGLGAEYISEDDLLKAIISEDPLFPLERDEEMIREDNENRERILKYHRDKRLCKIVRSSTVPSLSIEEKEAAGMSLQWLTEDDFERSPSFCTRKVNLEVSGATPWRKTMWEHQLYILSGKGILCEESRKTRLVVDTTVQVRPNLAFRVQNTGEEPLVYLHIVPSITHYFGR